MIGRLIDRIVRRQQRIHGTADADRRAAAALCRMEQIVREQKREAARVNPIYDRIARPRGERHA